METISLKSNSPDMLIPLLKTALNREKGILIETAKALKEKVNRLAKNASVNIDKLMAGEVEHRESNEMELIELEGELEILKHLEAEIDELDAVEICK